MLFLDRNDFLALGRGLAPGALLRPGIPAAEKGFKIWTEARGHYSNLDFRISSVAQESNDAVRKVFWVIFEKNHPPDQ